MRKFLLSFFEIFETVVVAVVAVTLVRAFIAQPFLVSGASMEPTFEHGDYLLVDELTYRFRKPLRGEVVVFKHVAYGNGSYYIKRIIGLPGERVVTSGGEVSIYSKDSNQKLKEGYVVPGSVGGSAEVTLREDEYFVMGDNRSFSFDSRSWGPVKKKEVLGLVRVRLWPVNKVMAFGAPAY